MKLTHTQKINGVLYRAGEEVPSPDEKPIVKEAIKQAEKPIEKPQKRYTRSEITLMKVADLRKLATEQGLVEDADDYTGSELKEMLIDKLV